MRRLPSLSIIALLPALCAGASAEHLAGTTQEVRTVLYYHIPPATLARFLPAGWVAADFTTGPASGANLTVNLSDQLANASAKNETGSEARGQGVTISARVRDPQTGENRSMVLFGFTNGNDSPGPYGVHRKATISMARTERTLADGRVAVSERWSAKTLQGDALSMDLSFIRGQLTPSHVDQQTRSSLHPEFYRIYKMDEQTDVVSSKAGGINHVSNFKVSQAGGAARYFDGLQVLVAIVSVPVFHREIWLHD
jgi:hypothetical protein